MVMGSGLAACLGLDKICCIGCDSEYHVTGTVWDDVDQISVEIVHQHGGSGDGFGHGGDLFC